MVKCLSEISSKISSYKKNKQIFGVDCTEAFLLFNQLLPARTNSSTEKSLKKESKYFDNYNFDNNFYIVRSGVKFYIFGQSIFAKD